MESQTLGRNGLQSLPENKTQPNRSWRWIHSKSTYNNNGDNNCDNDSDSDSNSDSDRDNDGGH